MQTIGFERSNYADRFRELLGYLIDLHRQYVPETCISFLSDQQTGGRLNILSAWIAGKYLGSKLVSVFGSNATTSKYPTVQGVYVLFSGVNGEPLAVINGSVLTGLKTAADSVLAASYLIAGQPETLLIVGAGALVPYVVRAYLSGALPIRNIIIWNRTPARAKSVIEQLSHRFPEVHFSVAERLGPAAKRTRLIVCATASQEPLLRDEWIQAGTHVDLIGGWRVDMHEAEARLLGRASVFVDSRENMRNCGDLVTAVADGCWDWADLRGTLRDLCKRGRPGDCRDITVYKNAGSAYMDLFVAMWMYESVVATTQAPRH